MRRGVLALAAGAAAVALAGGYAALDAADAVPGPLTTRPAPTAPALPTAPGAGPPATPAPVLPAPPADAPVPAPAVLGTGAADLLGAPALGPSVRAAVRDARTGEVLLDRGADATTTPASVTKLLTAAAALRVLGPDSRATTRVVAGTTPGEVVLVAGGDVLLDAGAGAPAAVRGHAGLDALAAATAGALRTAGTGPVAVRLDDTAFTGPAVSPGWGSGDVGSGYVMPIAPLAVDEGRLAAPGTVAAEDAPRAGDPALAAARAFAAALAARGTAVAPDVVRAPAPAGTRQLAAVESATTAEQVELMLTTSDNTLAEVLGRRTALAAGGPGSFDGASAAVPAAVADLGVDVAGVQLQGTSGLGRGTRLPVRVLTDLLVLAASGEHPELAALASGLPVAAVTGTLAERYEDPAEAGGAGVVRAKTGTLTGVSSLAGYVRDADGRLLAFAVVADAVPAGGTVAARNALDAYAAALAACGCR